MSRRAQGSGHFEALKNGRWNTFSSIGLMAENHRMHDPARQEREQAGDDERTRKNHRHDPAMVGDPMAPGPPHRDRQHDQREDVLGRQPARVSL